MNKISLFFACVVAVFLLWVGFSWLDVITDNLSQHPQHSKYNAFVLLVEFAEQH